MFLIKRKHTDEDDNKSKVMKLNIEPMYFNENSASTLFPDRKETLYFNNKDLELKQYFNIASASHFVFSDRDKTALHSKINFRIEVVCIDSVIKKTFPIPDNMNLYLKYLDINKKQDFIFQMISLEFNWHPIELKCVLNCNNYGRCEILEMISKLQFQLQNCTDKDAKFFIQNLESKNIISFEYCGANYAVLIASLCKMLLNSFEKDDLEEIYSNINIDALKCFTLPTKMHMKQNNFWQNNTLKNNYFTSSFDCNKCRTLLKPQDLLVFTNVKDVFLHLIFLLHSECNIKFIPYKECRIDNKLFKLAPQQLKNYQVFNNLIFEGSQTVKQRISNWKVNENQGFAREDATNVNLSPKFQTESFYTNCKIFKLFETVRIKSRIKGRNDLAEQIRGINNCIDFIGQVTHFCNIKLSKNLTAKFEADKKMDLQNNHSKIEKVFYNNQMECIDQSKNFIKSDVCGKKYLGNTCNTYPENDKYSNNIKDLSIDALLENTNMKLLPFNFQNYFRSKQMQQRGKKRRICYAAKSDVFKKDLKKFRECKKIYNCKIRKISQFFKHSAGKNETQQIRSHITSFHLKEKKPSTHSNNTNIQNVMQVNNEMISVEDIAYDLNFCGNSNEKFKIFTSDFEIHKSESEKIIPQFTDSSCKKTSFTATEIKDISEAGHEREKIKNAACQTESLSELFEKYSDLSNLILKFQNSKALDHEESKGIKLFSELISLEKNCGVQDKKTFIKLTGRNLFDSREARELSSDLSISEKVYHETVHGLKCEFFNCVPDSVTQDQEVLGKESVCLNKEHHDINGKDERKEKIKNISSSRRSKVRMGLSRKQRVKPLHPDFKYKEVFT
ncbi:uncharacterized protein NPIL_200821 [Nephila pilipes]|uniref:Uncharacterized protein n=1 Tax=Nephila pilipes TaxID=299642 RepID=A0A8X6TIW2_NEPPI|nr:uncharacterized protein NPIL_200821 [Nephila pilipes]